MQFATCLLFAICSPALADFSFIAIGDWGGDSDRIPATQNQKLTAVGIQAIAQNLGVNFTLLMGDNMYEHGVACSAESSDRFKTTFKQVYADLLPGLPFYVLAGNHDYGEGRQANVSSQLAYSEFDPQWRFPALWYKIRREFHAGAQTRTLEVLIIDTVILCGNGPDNEEFVNNELRPLWTGGTGLRPRLIRRAMAQQQWAWLEQQLDASTADFLWVAGHYPIWSGGNDGSTQCLIDRLRPMLIKHKAQYISGHDHMLEHFHHEGLDTFVAGAGKECCYRPITMQGTPNGALRYLLAGENGSLSVPVVPFPVYGGFASLHFTAEHASVTFHSDTGYVLYTSPPMSRRTIRHESSTRTLNFDAVREISQQKKMWCAVCVVIAYFLLVRLALLPKRGLDRIHGVTNEPLLAT